MEMFLLHDASEVGQWQRATLPFLGRHARPDVGAPPTTATGLTAKSG